MNLGTRPRKCDKRKILATRTTSHSQLEQRVLGLCGMQLSQVRIKNSRPDLSNTNSFAAGPTSLTTFVECRKFASRSSHQDHSHFYLHIFTLPFHPAAAIASLSLHQDHSHFYLHIFTLPFHPLWRPPLLAILNFYSLRITITTFPVILDMWRLPFLAIQGM
jgi:hypothetical protein